MQNLVLISEPRGFLRPLFFECLGAHSQIQGMFPILILKFCFRNLFQGMLAICRLFFVRHLIQECQRRNCVKQNVGSVLETDWKYLSIVFRRVALLHNMPEAFIVVKALLHCILLLA